MQTTPISVIKYDNDKEDKNKFNALLERFGNKIGKVPDAKQNDSQSYTREEFDRRRSPSPPPYTREEFDRRRSPSPPPYTREEFDMRRSPSPPPYTREEFDRRRSPSPPPYTREEFDMRRSPSPPPYTREEFKQNTECNCEQCQMKRASFNKQPQNTECNCEQCQMKRASFNKQPPDDEKNESKTDHKERWQYNFSQLDNGAVSITSPSIAGIDIQWVILAIVICILLFQIMSWYKHKNL
jgi:hypothetical protein